MGEKTHTALLVIGRRNLSLFLADYEDRGAGNSIRSIDGSLRAAVRREIRGSFAVSYEFRV